MYKPRSTAEDLAERERAVRETSDRKGGQQVARSYCASGALEFGATTVIRCVAGNAMLTNDLWTPVSPGNFGVSAIVPSRRVPNELPQARSVFVISKVAATKGAFDRAEEKVLHFGEPFQLACHPCLVLDERHDMMGPSFYLRSDRPLGSGKQLLTMTKDHRDPKTHFMVLPLSCAAKADPNSADFINARGKRVPVNTVISLRHVMTGLSVALCHPGPKNNNNPATMQDDPIGNSGTSFTAGASLCVECISARTTQDGLGWTFETALKNERPASFKELPARITKPSELLKKIRTILCEREGGEAHHGIRAIGREFKIMDTDRSGRLDKDELLSGLEKFGVSLDEEQVALLLDFCDTDHQGTVDFNEFLVALRGPLTKRRLKLILMAYQVLDRNHDGTVTLEELSSFYDTSCHPDVLNGRKTHEQVIKEFIAQWDNGGDSGAGKGDGVITKEEFVHYYRDVSASIDDDDYFELMIRNAWHISGGEGWCENTTNIRCLVTHSDDSCEIVELKDDFGVSRHDMPMIRTILRKQGVTDIKRVSLAD